MVTKVVENIVKLSLECCEGVAEIELILSGDPAGYQFGLIGTYYQQAELVSGRNYWVKDNGAYAIWYTNVNVVMHLFTPLIFCQKS